jgi:hypothetical protein
MRSPGLIDRLRLGQHVIPRIPAEVLRRPQVYFSAHEFRQLQLHGGESDQTGNVIRLELHEDIHVASRPEILAEN